MSGPVDTAILLAAGQGSRLREVSLSKPLCLVAGKPLIDHALDGLVEAGIARAIVVTGYGAEDVEAHVAGRAQTIRTRDWRLPNGVSALAAAALTDNALLAMCDHIVDPELYRRMAEAGPGPGLRLGIDRRLGHWWVDPDDVTCVRTKAMRIAAIGKGLEPHDAYDTGVFAVGPRFFEALDAMNDPSITDAVRRLAGEERAEAVDCSDLDWIDVDDPAALAKAEGWLAASPSRRTGARPR